METVIYRWRINKILDIYLWNYGRVYSEWYNKILQPSIDKYGYLVYTIVFSNGKQKVKKIHRLVAETFIIVHGADENEVNHKDGDKTNNCVDNLEYCTSKDNKLHYINNKDIINFEWKNNPNYTKIIRESEYKKQQIELYKKQQKKLKQEGIKKYSDDILHEICKEISKGTKVKDICLKLNVKKSVVHDLKYKRRNKHIWSKYNF